MAKDQLDFNQIGADYLAGYFIQGWIIPSLPLLPETLSKMAKD
jgi:hypothetical protein